MIGFSTHSVDQAVEAARLPIDYLAIGPIFATATKENPSPVVGLDGLRAVRSATGSIPLVAIGGITPANAAEVLAAGADSVAMISGLWSAPENLRGYMCVPSSTAKPSANIICLRLSSLCARIADGCAGVQENARNRPPSQRQHSDFGDLELNELLRFTAHNRAYVAGL